MVVSLVVSEYHRVDDTRFNYGYGCPSGVVAVVPPVAIEKLFVALAPKPRHKKKSEGDT